jgi:Lrp/AsnC family leucine-responsive transcriptional regulator
MSSDLRRPKQAVLDQAGIRILRELEEDGRLSYTDLAERVGLSKTPCWKRVQDLEAAGIIQGYRAVLDPGRLGLEHTVFVNVTLELGHQETFEAAVVAHPLVLECHTTAGASDYLLRVAVGSVVDLDRLLREELRNLPGVQRLSSLICLKPIKKAASLAAAADVAIRTRVGSGVRRNSRTEQGQPIR